MSMVWLFTGASRGFGRAFTEEALQAGHHVLAHGSQFGELVDTNRNCQPVGKCQPTSKTTVEFWID